MASGETENEREKSYGIFSFCPPSIPSILNKKGECWKELDEFCKKNQSHGGKSSTLLNQETKEIPTIQIFPASPLQVTDQNAVYFVTGTNGQNLPPLESLVAEIQSPGGAIQIKKLLLDQNHSSVSIKSPQYFVCFFPQTFGIYKISLKIKVPSSFSPSGNDQENCFRFVPFGNPLKVFISRNYSLLKKSLNFIVESKFLVKPWGIAIDHRLDYIYLADRGRDQIIILNSSGKIVGRFGRSGKGVGELWRPTGIAIDQIHDRIVVADKDNNRISIFSLAGEFLFSFGSQGHQDGQFKYPWGVDVSKDGELIAVADSRNYRIQMFDQDGNFLRKFSVFEKSPFEYKNEFHYPRGICFDKTGKNLYVTDFNLEAVFKLDCELQNKTAIIPKNPSFHRPQGLALDPVGNLLVCEKQSIVVVNPSSGDLISSINFGKAKSPVNLAVFGNGKIAAVDEETGRFYIF